jgi:hypothetical protein
MKYPLTLTESGYCEIFFNVRFKILQFFFTSRHNLEMSQTKIQIGEFSITVTFTFVSDILATNVVKQTALSLVDTA